MTRIELLIEALQTIRHDNIFDNNRPTAEQINIGNKAVCDMALKRDRQLADEEESQLHKAERLLVDILEGKYTYYQSDFKEDGSFNPDYYDMIQHTIVTGKLTFFLIC